MNSGGQYQVIIGQTVDKVYDKLCKVAGFETQEMVTDQEEKGKEKMTPKSVAMSVLDGVAGCLTPLIPMLMAASMFKLLTALLGPDMLNILSTKSDLYILFTFVGDAGFYFFPVIVGYTAAKKFGVTPVIAMFLGGILIHPTLVAMATKGSVFTIFGIPCNVQNYSGTILPIILSVWVMSYVERFFKKILPSVLKTIFSPTLTIIVMLPISLCLLAPAGSIVGSAICNGLLSFSKAGGIFGILVIAIIGAFYELLVMSGMHLVLISTLILVFSTNGSESLVSPAALAASMAVAGMCLGGALRIRNKEEKGLSFGYFIAAFIGGVTEPGLYGMAMKYKRPFLGVFAGGFAGALYGGITHITAYALIPIASFLNLFAYVGGGNANIVNAIITAALSVVVAAIVTYLFGFEKDSELLKIEQ